ncbi:hypothetical protein [Dactylosporangium salmoneum]|uniref:DUF559 domain-containing protein n=1 Tax=Dactylosporangium salmoneum TaxID=53361 RepID=A0ABP5T2E3_9ACTN
MDAPDWPPPAETKPDTRTYSELLEDPRLTEEAALGMRADAALGHTAALLLQRGKRDLVALLVDAEGPIVEWDPECQEYDLWLEVPADQRMRFTDEVMEEIRNALKEVDTRFRYGLAWLGVREILPPVGPGWRGQVRSQLTGKRPTNHARKVRSGPPVYVRDFLSFTNEGELAVYDALKGIQENELPRENTIGIYPLAGGRIPDHTWEPDFLITYGGRAGVLEVDGPHHNSRRAMDATRDHLLRDAGVGFVDRIPVEALTNPSELVAVLRRFVRRLSQVK